MPLPKINAPMLELNLPSTGQAVKYRPFLVKEQKILLMAMNTDDETAMIVAVKQIVNNCMIDPVLDVNKMPIFDLEYFFLRLRAKSVGEDINLTLRHPTGMNSKGKECDGATEMKLNLLDVDVIKTIAHTDKVVLDDETGVGIKFKYPDGELATSFKIDENSNQMEVATDAMLNCIEYIFDKDNVYQKADTTRDELIEFIDNLSQEQFLKLSNFFETMPKLKHEIKWNCKKCGCSDSVTLEGLGSFFG
jgi:hypothetical protein